MLVGHAGLPGGRGDAGQRSRRRVGPGTGEGVLEFNGLREVKDDYADFTIDKVIVF